MPIDAPLFLLPLGRRTSAGWRVVEFLGGKHANFNMGLWRRDVAASIGADDTARGARALAGRADVLQLHQSAADLGRHHQSFRAAAASALGQSTASAARWSLISTPCCARAPIPPTRKKMRKKERTLASFGAVRFEQRARAGRRAPHARRLLQAEKRAHAHARRRRRVCAARACAASSRRPRPNALAGGEPLIELYALSVDDIIVATYGGIVGGGRFCAMFNSIIQDRYAAESPGEQLLVRLVQHCCERGLDTFRSRHRRSELQDPVLQRRRTAVRQLSAA